MSQILRLCSGHIYRKQINTAFVDTASEIARFQGCCHCRILRSKAKAKGYEHEGHQITSRRQSYSSAKVKKEEGPLIVISRSNRNSLEKQLKTYENLLRTSIVQSIYGEENIPIKSDWIDQSTLDTVKRSSIFIDQAANEKSKTIQKIQEVKRKEIKWGAQLKRFERQLKRYKPSQQLDSNFGKSRSSLKKLKPTVRQKFDSNSNVDKNFTAIKADPQCNAEKIDSSHSVIGQHVVDQHDQVQSFVSSAVEQTNVGFNSENVKLIGIEPQTNKHFNSENVEPRTNVVFDSENVEPRTNVVFDSENVDIESLVSEPSLGLDLQNVESCSIETESNLKFGVESENIELTNSESTVKFGFDIENVKSTNNEFDLLSVINKFIPNKTLTQLKDSKHQQDVQDENFNHQKSTAMLQDNELSVEKRKMPTYNTESYIDKDKFKLRRREKDIKQLNEEDIKRKQAYFNKEFKSYVDACIFANKAEQAYLALRFYRSQNGKEVGYKHVTDVSTYSTLLHHYAKTGNISRMTEIMNCMKELNVKPDLQCYVAFLESLGRQETIDFDKGHDILQEMTSEGYDIRNVLHECTIVEDERNYILRALNQLIKDFEPYPPPSHVPYYGALLEPLNESRQFAQVEEKNPFSGVVSTDHIVKQLKTQMDMESNDVISVQTIERKSPLTDKDKEMEKKLKELKESWRKTLHQAFKKKLKTLQQHDKHGMTLLPYFRLFEQKEYIDLVMSEIEHLSSSSLHYSPSCNQLWYRLGERIYNRYIVKYKKQTGITDKLQKVYTDFAKIYNDPDPEITNYREGWKDLCLKHVDGPTIDPPLKSWSYHLKKHIGKTLYDLIMYELKIETSTPDENKRTVPAFYYVYRSYDYTYRAQLKPHPVLIKLFTGNYIQHLTFDTSELPMLVPPVPWYSPRRGGYLLNGIQLARTTDVFYDNVIESIPSHQINAVYDALNVLDMCAWRINKPMLNVIVDMFNNKGNKDLDIPPPVSECPPLPQITINMTAEEKAQVKAERKILKQRKQEMYSLWCNELYKLSIANKFKDHVFWFPHNLDFRGRSYPCPPHFNHLGSDVTRSLLYFAKGKRLGEKGLDWLKIHLVNLTGFKKRSSNAERLDFANEMMDEILDSADNPIHGRKWWQTSDEPWQTLAACKEVAKAVRSSDTANYVCHFPVHQDGSCNGLQHYAALGRDQAGAESVNLYPFDSPKDVYSDVAELVEKVRIEDAAEDNKIAQILEGFVRRKVIKQTVMTTVYGVTPYGARYQILRQLKDIPEFPEEYQWKASAYLTQTTFKCLQKMFTSSKEIQEWFISSADHISNICKKPVEWVTPLGLPVVQPYFRRKVINLYGHTPHVSEQNQLENPNTKKQKNGFPPNYIHSLDSVHMMLTALYCYRAGITYVSVHDCYWTHPCDVDIMNKICREQFIALHSQPILEDLSKFMLDKFKDIPKNEDEKEKLETILSKVPERGTFDLDKVKDSTYFFS